jgi:hypothetical protein
MSDQNPMTITVEISTRASMNTATPRHPDGWTYHHVLPVRLYFMAAWMILHVCKNRHSWHSTRIVGRNALLSLCQIQNNHSSILEFLRNPIDADPTPAAIAEIAKLCASPRAGGFYGPNGGQRDDDPHDGVEPFAPVSAPTVWFASLAKVALELKDAFGLLAMPTVNTPYAAQHSIAQWCAHVESISKMITVADTSGTVPFDRTDWRVVGEDSWTIQGLQGRNVRNTDPRMVLRRRSEASTYSAGPSRNTVLLTKVGQDRLKLIR